MTLKPTKEPWVAGKPWETYRPAAGAPLSDVPVVGSVCLMGWLEVADDGVARWDEQTLVFIKGVHYQQPEEPEVWFMTLDSDENKVRPVSQVSWEYVPDNTARLAEFLMGHPAVGTRRSAPQFAVDILNFLEGETHD